MKNRKKIAVIDAETDPFLFGRIPKPFIWGYYNGGDYKQFRHTKDLLGFIAERDEIIYAHNGGRFDFHFIINHLGPDVDLKIINGRIAEFKFGRCTLRDSYLLLPTALRAYQKDDFDYTKLEADVREQHMSEIEKYLRHDCEYLYNYIADFFDKYPRTLTIAAAAVKMFETIQDVKMNHVFQSHDHEFRPYYFGGRVQAFETGIITRHRRAGWQGSNFKLYDINSAYPDAMTKKHPWGRDYYVGRGSGGYFDELRFYHVNVDISTPCLLKRDRFNALSLPVGEAIDLFVPGHELIAAVELGYVCVNKIHSFLGCSETITFADYVAHFFALKKQAKKDGNKTDEIFAKLFLNSLYGKLATNPADYQRYKTARWDAVPTDYMPVTDHFGDHDIVICARDDNTGRYFNVATAASITSAVRAKLMYALHEAKRPLYCDTDSILCESLPDDFVGTELGQWDIEAECDTAAIAGKKLYALKQDGEWIKMSSKGARLSGDEIARVAAGETVTWRNDAPTFHIGNKVDFIEREIRLTTQLASGQVRKT